MNASSPGFHNLPRTALLPSVAKTLQRLSKIHAVSGWIAVQCYGPVYLLSFRPPFGQHFGANEHGIILAA
jgi:hypothetical protein